MNPSSIKSAQSGSKNGLTHTDLKVTSVAMTLGKFSIKTELFRVNMIY
jgi:hypothetical protein